MSSIASFVHAELRKHAHPANAAAMAAYGKTTQPFLGLPNPIRRPVFQDMCARFAPATLADYRKQTLALWQVGTAPVPKGQRNPIPPRRDSKETPPIYAGPREMMYAACHYAERFKTHHVPASLPLFRQLIVEGGWWDIVDWVAIKCVGGIMRNHPAVVRATLDEWIDDECLWLRRTAIIAQIGLKHQTDEKLLLRYCVARAGERDFFIRKAIGWALRQHARINPELVGTFLIKHRAKLSPLSIREAGKHIGIAP